MFHCRTLLPIFLGLVIGLAGRADAATVAEVEAAIQRARECLYAQQKNGHWEPIAAPSPKELSHPHTQWGGRTALATYALLAAGEKQTDPRLAQAIAFLKKAEINGVYALAMRCQVWLLLPQTPEVKAAMRKDAAALLQMVHTEGKLKGLHPYGPGMKASSPYSHSRTQYAVLGIWAAAQAGVEVPRAYWQSVEAVFMRHQDPSGGWSYQAMNETKYPMTPGMTAAGLASLFITIDQLNAGGAACAGNVSNPAIDRGMKWLADNFDKVASSNRYARDFPYSTLYTIERVGVASGLKYIGKHDWYKTGAAWLVTTQKKDGSWSSGEKVFEGLPDTCFGLLFLIRGRAPVVINKLEYTIDAGGKKGPGNWNQRPRDAAGLVHWTGKELERYLNWQIVSLQAPVEDMADSPILYIAGNQALGFTEEEEKKLRQYVEEGGLILGNADCSNAAFVSSFRNLGSKLFPAYEFREVPADHSIMQDQQFRSQNWKNRPKLFGLSNGARELMLLLPEDPAKHWQTQAVETRPELHQVAANIILYAVEKQNLRNKGETHLVARDPRIEPESSMKVARIEFAGNWDPEPAGWRRLANIMHNDHKLAIQVETVKLGQGKLDASFKLAHLTGTGPLPLGPEAVAELKKFMEAGGTVLVDAAGGDGRFAQSAEAVLAGTLPNSALGGVLTLDHPALAAIKLDRVEFRPAARKALGSTRGIRLRGGEVGGRTALIFSAEDLSVGAVGQPVDGIIGYDPASAGAIMRNIILYAAGKTPQAKPPQLPGT